MPHVSRTSQLTPEAESNFQLKGKITRDGQFTYGKKLHVAYGDMAPMARFKALGIRIGAVAAIAGFFYYNNIDGNGIIGKTNRERTISEVLADTQAQSEEAIKKANFADKFSIQYVNPNVTNSPIYVDGAGILGWLQPHRNLFYRYGQDCLNGTGYDTTGSIISGPSTGEISAVASLNINEDGDLVVYPAGSNAAPLVFSEDETTGFLEPDQVSAKTLHAYGCEPNTATAYATGSGEQYYGTDWNVVQQS